jgi:parallel beta-helix repeat protein
MGINYKTIAIVSLLVFIFLLGFSLSVQAYRISRQELNSPVSRYLRENYGVNSIEEYRAKLEQEIWLNISRQMEALATEYPELNFSEWQSPDVYRQYGTSTYQPPKITSQQLFYAVISEPVTALQVFSLSGLGLIGLATVPPIRKSKRLRQALVLGIVVLATFSVGYFVGLTAAQTGTITIEPASFSGDYSYLIETDGTYVWAKNGKTGQIEFSGTDAATVIQSAINALTSGGKIFLKAGAYNLTKKVSLAGNVQLEAEKGAVFNVQTGFTDKCAIHVLNVNSVVLDGFTLNCNWLTEGVRIEGSSDVVVRGLTVNKAKYADSGMNIDVYNSQRVIVVDNIVSNAYDDDISVTYYSKDVIIANNICKDYTYSPPRTSAGSGIECDDGAENIIIVGNKVKDKLGGITAHGLHTGLPPAKYLTIVGNMIEHIDALGQSLYVVGFGISLDTGPQYVVIANNIIRDSESAGINLNKVSDVNIEGNYIYNSGRGTRAPEATDGIIIKGCQRVTVKNNIISTSSDRNIYIRIGSDNTTNSANVLIEGNLVYNSIVWNIDVVNCLQPSIKNNLVVGGSQGIRIYSANVKNYEVSGNYVTASSGDGIIIDTSDNGSVVGNYVVANGANGINIWNSNGVFVSGNTCKNNDQAALTKAGIYLRNSMYSMIINNYVIDDQATPTQDYGIWETQYQGTSDYNQIRNNCLKGNPTAISKVGANTVVKGNIGYDTENFKASGLSVTVGTGGAYGSATAITTPSGRVTYPRVKITWGGTFGTGETVTVKVEAVYTDGSTAYVEKSATATGSLWLTDDDIMSLITQGKDIVKLNVYAKTNLSSTTVTVTVDAYGKA